MTNLAGWIRICGVLAWVNLGLAILLLLMGCHWLALFQLGWAAYLFVVMLLYERLDNVNKDKLGKAVAKAIRDKQDKNSG